MGWNGVDKGKGDKGAGVCSGCSDLEGFGLHPSPHCLPSFTCPVVGAKHSVLLQFLNRVDISRLCKFVLKPPSSGNVPAASKDKGQRDRGLSLSLGIHS